MDCEAYSTTTVCLSTSEPTLPTVEEEVQHHRTTDHLPSLSLTVDGAEGAEESTKVRVSLYPPAQDMSCSLLLP
jgi:hypothetical protein